MTLAETGAKQGRLYFLDNLRTFMIFLVVVVHSGLIYESAGYAGTFWIVDDPVTTDLTGLINLFLDMFIMSVIFYVSGYLVPRSIASHKGWEFVKTKFKRLIIPWLVAVFTLMPLYKFIFFYSRGLPQGDWTTYFHFSNGIFSMNWLWFLPALFLFHMIYYGLSKIGGLSINLSLIKAGIITFIFGFVYSYAMSMAGAEGWTKTPFFDFQNERIFIYFMMYVLGALSYKLKIFDKLPGKKTLYYIVNSTIWLPMCTYAIFLLNFFLRPGQYITSLELDVILLWFSFHLSIYGILYILVDTFRFYFNKQGKIGAILNTSSFGVYIIHVIVMGMIATLLLGVGLSAISKYVILVLTTFISSTAIVRTYKYSIKKIF